jgi:hypothetical protein
MVRFSIGMALVVALAAPALAQTDQAGATAAKPAAAAAPAAAAKSGGDDFKFDVDGGYDYLHVHRTVSGGTPIITTYKKGYDVGAQFRYQHWMSLIAEANWNQGVVSTTKRSSYLVGVRFSNGSKMAVKPFGEILIGPSNCHGLQVGVTSATVGCDATGSVHFSLLQVGGGADFKIGDRAALRAKISVPDFLNPPNLTKNYRISIDIVLKYFK